MRPTPLTGPFSAEAQDQVRAARLAIEDFNAAGGFNGRMAELLVCDIKLNSGEAATRTLELIEKDKVDFIVGSLSAATQLSIDAVARDRKIIFNSICQSDTINEAKGWSLHTFHEALNPHMTAGAVARYAFPKFGKKIVYLTADYAYGQERVRGFERAGKALGATKLADIRHPLGAADYSAFIPRLQSLKPDVLVLCNFDRDLVNSAKQITNFGLKEPTKVITPVLLFTARQAGGADAHCAFQTRLTSWAREPSCRRAVVRSRCRTGTSRNVAARSDRHGQRLQLLRLPTLRLPLHQPFLDPAHQPVEHEREHGQHDDAGHHGVDVEAAFGLQD